MPFDLALESITPFRGKIGHRFSHIDTGELHSYTKRKCTSMLHPLKHCSHFTLFTNILIGEIEATNDKQGSWPFE
jgi:hypothetical protein